MQRVRCFAPAKVNLALHVTGRRRNGYHDIDSIVAFADSGDWLEVSRAGRGGGGVVLAVQGPFADRAGPDDDNLARRALDGYLEAIGCHDGLTVTLEKNLPVAAGLGGGSADAAAALRAVAGLCPPVDDSILMAIAARTGADVPMCLHSGFLRARGSGEQIERLADPIEFPALLVYPGIGLPTPQVFAALGSRENEPIRLGPDPADIDFLAGLRNDLQEPAIALAPQIGDILRLIETRAGCLFSRMSGSGSTCFGLFADMDAAGRAARDIRDVHPKYWCMPVRLGSPDIALRRHEETAK